MPAYRDFAGDRTHRARQDRLDFIHSLPVTDKRSYIDRYSLAERCVDGRLPMIGTQLDESSGSSGVPYNWVRSRRSYGRSTSSSAAWRRISSAPTW